MVPFEDRGIAWNDPSTASRPLFCVRLCVRLLVIARLIVRYNQQGLHRVLAFLRPLDCYRCDPSTLHMHRRRKLAQS